MNTLKRRTLAIGLMIALASSLAHAASFIIDLHNGRAISTPHVWEEGEEIKCYTAHGTVGVPKNQVKRIKAIDLVSHDKGSRRSQPLSAADPPLSTTDGLSEKNPQKDADIRREEGKGQPSSGKQHDGGARLKAGDAQAYHAKKVMFTSHLDAATNRYLEASAARDPDAKKAALDEMREYSKNILDLGDEVKHKNGGVLPPWWNE